MDLRTNRPNIQVAYRINRPLNLGLSNPLRPIALGLTNLRSEKPWDYLVLGLVDPRTNGS